MKIAFIVKGNIRNKRKFYEDLTLVENTNLFEEVEVLESDYHQHSIELARTAARSSFNYLIAVGGDGTLNEVVNGMFQVLDEDASIGQPIVGFLRYGTANDFARTAKLNGGIDQLLYLLENRHSKKIDLGRMDFLSEEGDPLKRYFVNVADAGIGAYVVKKVNQSKKRLGANFTFLRAITETFLTYEQSVVHLKTNNGYEYRGKVLNLVVANGNYYGSGLCIAPDARLDDGRLNLVVVGNIKTKDYILNLGKLKKGKKIDHPQMHYESASIIEMTPEQYSCAVEADGEFLGYAPMKIEMLYHALDFLMPSEN